MNSISVIISTYNDPRALGLVFAGLARQTRPPDEVLIADDGSGPPTRAVVDGWATRLPYPVQHVWHPDDGFRKCTILNRAIRAAQGEYLVFFDGDCVPQAHCLGVHAARARPGHYVSGGAVMLGKRFSDALAEDDVSAGVLDRIGWWWLDAKRARRLLAGRIPLLREVLDRNLKRPPGWRGGNASTYAAHVRAVGGFDERFSYGYEDADFGHRLLAAGVRGLSVRYSAPVLHVYHHDQPRPYARAEAVAANKALYDANRAAHVIATPYGLKEATDEHR